MNNRLDELAKRMAQSATRRQALKRFSLGLAGMALACFGLVREAEASRSKCVHRFGACDGYGLPCCHPWGCDVGKGICD
jgi:hypothetical protein